MLSCVFVDIVPVSTEEPDCVDQEQFLSELDEAPCPARFGTFLTRSSEFFIFSSLVPRLLGVMFTSLLDLYLTSRSCHEVFDELIPEVLLSTLKPCINTKLQN
jgi:hypothetical protein